MEPRNSDLGGLGHLLREARERRGLTLVEAAEHTKTKPGIIEALERDSYTRLTAPVYAKGFYRIYCEFLGLDPQPFIDSYLRNVGQFGRIVSRPDGDVGLHALHLGQIDVVLEFDLLFCAVEHDFSGDL